jgi:hypothetical protein
MTVATKARPKDKPAVRRATIIEAMDTVFLPWFPRASDGTDTWANWKCVLRAMDALAMTADEIEFFKSIAGGREPPKRRVSELVAACARRTGKDSVASVIAAHASATFDQQDKLRPGERAQVLCLACDRDQAKIVLNYIRSYFQDIPALRAMVEAETKDGFALNNRIDITVATNSFRSVRGRPVYLAILDEAAFMMSETSASPDTELYAALRPSLLTIPGSRIVIISSPYRRVGLLWDRYHKFFGQNDDSTLVIQADVRSLNPTISQAAIDAETEQDPAAAVSELQGQFRNDIDSFISRESIEAVTSVGVFERGFVPGQVYYAFTDPSGGSSDSMTIAVGHLERGKIDSEKTAVVDAVREVKAPFSPENTVDEFVQLLQSYTITAVTGDRYGSNWVSERFRVHGVKYEPAEKPKSDLYKDVLPAINSGQVDFLDHPRMLAQFVSLERRTARGGRDSIDHPPGQKDDLANAVAGLCCLIRAQSNITRTRMVRINFMGR